MQMEIDIKAMIFLYQKMGEALIEYEDKLSKDVISCTLIGEYEEAEKISKKLACISWSRSQSIAAANNLMKLE